jgi:hypothetical protein
VDVGVGREASSREGVTGRTVVCNLDRLLEIGLDDLAS